MKKTNQEQLEQKILNTAIKAGEIIKANAFNLEYVEWKHLDDPVTDLDRKTEQYIKDSLKEYHLNYVGEEYGKESNGSDITLLIDPIDGTKSFMRKEFHSAVSIAAEKNGEIFFGVVYDFMRNIAYYADNTGAYVMLPEQKKTIKLPITYPSLSKMTVSIDDVPYINTILENDKNYELRKPIGSVALNMALLAQGSYDGLIMKMKKGDIYDIAAGCYIMKQAGIHMQTLAGGEFEYTKHKQGLIALRPDIADKVLDDIERGEYFAIARKYLSKSEIKKLEELSSDTNMQRLGKLASDPEYQ
jgi:myo-inositol-1(or 4)-monophosphatase